MLLIGAMGADNTS